MPTPGCISDACISEEVKRAAYAAPSAIFIAVIGTGIIGWLFNIVLVLCSGDMCVSLRIVLIGFLIVRQCESPGRLWQCCPHDNGHENRRAWCPLSLGKDPASKLSARHSPNVYAGLRLLDCVLCLPDRAPSMLTYRLCFQS